MANEKNLNSWIGTEEQTHMHQTYTFNTENKYCSNNIVVNVDVPGMIVPTPSTGENPNSFWIEIGGIRYTWNVNSDGDVWID